MATAEDGGEGKIIEADEAYIGRIDGRKGNSGYGHKYAVFSLVERGGGARSISVGKFSGKKIQELIREHVHPDTRLMTDRATWYKKGFTVASHETVNHMIGEYARGDVTTNTVESFFSVFKRGMNGTYQHCDQKHLQRYLDEFDFRYNNRVALGVNDLSRADRALKGISGKRLKYRTAD